LTQCSSAQDVAPETSAGPTVADVSAIADERSFVEALKLFSGCEITAGVVSLLNRVDPSKRLFVVETECIHYMQP